MVSQTLLNSPSISPTNTPPKVPTPGKSSSIPPGFGFINGPPAGTASGTGASTRIPLPTFNPSSGIALPSITQPASLNSSSSRNATSTSCGQCSVMAEQVQVFYWPTASIKTNCARASSALPFQTGPVYATNATSNATRTVSPLGGDGAIDVISGFT